VLDSHAGKQRQRRGGLRHGEPDGRRLRGGDLIRPAGEHHHTGLQDRDPVREFLRLLQVVGGEDDGDATVDQVPDDPPDRPPALRVQPRGRLVQDHHTWAAEQRQRQVEPPSLTSGKGPHPDVGATDEVHLLQGLRDRSRVGQRAGPGLDGLSDGEVSG
jgi:hypothetical protein